MKSQIAWRIQNRVLYWKLAGNIPAEELCESVRFIHEVANTVQDGRLHLIVDASGVRSVAHQDNGVRNAFRALAHNTKMGKVAGIVPNLMMQVQFNAISNCFGLDWRYTHDLREAQRYLEFSDITLTALPKLPLDQPVRRTTTLNRLATQQMRAVPKTEKARRTQLLQGIKETQEAKTLEFPAISRRSSWIDHTETFVTTS